MIRVILGLGSNRGYGANSPEDNLRGACFRLSELLRDVVMSSVYRTKAMYFTEQDDFLNMVLAGYADDSSDPFLFLDRSHGIEAEFGRDRKTEFRNGPRPLDIDIELFGGREISSPSLQIPHPRIHERAFVLVPMLEILKNPADVNLRQKYQEYLDSLDASCVIKEASAFSA